MALYSTTLLQMIQEVTKRIGIGVPTVVINSTDPQVKQLLALANEEGEDLSERHDWQALKTETTFTTVALNLQGTLISIAPGFKYLIGDTIWNRTQRVPIKPIDERWWQMFKATAVSGPYSSFRIQGDSVYLIPAPTAGETAAFEYQDRRWCMDTTEATKRSAWAVDTDLPRLDPGLMQAGLIWRWKKTKGFEYAEEFNSYERRVLNAIARDGARPTLNMNAGGGTPSINTPEGSWNL